MPHILMGRTDPLGFHLQIFRKGGDEFFSSSQINACAGVGLGQEGTVFPDGLAIHPPKTGVGPARK